MTHTSFIFIKRIEIYSFTFKTLLTSSLTRFVKNHPSETSGMLSLAMTLRGF